MSTISVSSSWDTERLLYFWPAYSEIVRTIQDRFDKEGIPFARPSQSVSLLPESGNLANLPQAPNVLPGSEPEAA
jgi:small-conductance mechanosensitive channel